VAYNWCVTLPSFAVKGKMNGFAALDSKTAQCCVVGKGQRTEFAVAMKHDVIWACAMFTEFWTVFCLTFWGQFKIANRSTRNGKTGLLFYGDLGTLGGEPNLYGAAQRPACVTNLPLIFINREKLGRSIAKFERFFLKCATFISGNNNAILKPYSDCRYKQK
jgi:hypothetical protein